MKCGITILFPLLCLIMSIGYAQSPSSMQQTLLPLENVLNTDGTINTKSGFTGTLDPRGYRMTINKKGAPQFVPTTESMVTVSADSSWADGFGLPGTSW